MSYFVNKDFTVIAAQAPLPIPCVPAGRGQRGPFSHVREWPPLDSPTAPYCREARVTFPRRQTACRMQHCCARRIVECSVRRKLGCTSTRWAERQRIVEAEASRLAALNTATPRYGQCNRQASPPLTAPLRGAGTQPRRGFAKNFKNHLQTAFSVL